MEKINGIDDLGKVSLVDYAGAIKHLEDVLKSSLILTFFKRVVLKVAIVVLQELDAEQTRVY